MSTTNAENLRCVDGVTVPDGDYEGTWGGYRATFEFEGRRYECDTKRGIRTPSVPAIIRISQSGISVSVKPVKTTTVVPLEKYGNVLRPNTRRKS